MGDGTAILLIIVLGILLVLSALFSATEMAYTSMNTVRMKNLAEIKKKASARRALKLSENYDRLLSSLLIGNNIVNISAASIATIIFSFYYGDLGVTISTITMSVLVLVFAEITPKSIAKERPEAFAMFISLPLSFFCTICTPLNWLFDVWKSFLIKVFRLEKKQPTMTEDEFKIMLAEIKKEGVLNATELKLIRNTLKYDETLVETIMTPIKKTTMVEAKMPLNAIKQVFEDTSYSRIPVYTKKKDNILGILYRSDFYEMLLNQDCKLQDIIVKVSWTRPDVKISLLFSRLQKRKQHIAIVGDKGKVFGLVTLEDILEELVGEIEDENDE